MMQPTRSRLFPGGLPARMAAALMPAELFSSSGTAQHQVHAEGPGVPGSFGEEAHGNGKPNFIVHDARPKR